jgi:hypothetical protein
LELFKFSKNKYGYFFLVLERLKKVYPNFKKMVMHGKHGRIVGLLRLKSSKTLGFG